MGNKKCIKFKTFTSYGRYSSVDSEVNRWLDRYPNITVIDFRYAMGDDTSKLCIMYEESKNEN